MIKETAIEDNYEPIPSPSDTVTLAIACLSITFSFSQDYFHQTSKHLHHHLN